MSDAAAENESKSDSQSKPPSPTAKRPRKKRGWLFRIARGLFVFVLSIVLLLAGAVFYLTTDSGKGFVKQKLTAGLQKRFNGTISIDSLDYELLGPISIGGFKVQDKEGRTAIAVGELTLALAWKELGGPVVPIDSFVLRDVSVDIIKNEDGSSNLTNIFISKPIEKTIDIRKLTVENIDVSISNADGSKTRVNDLGIAGSVRTTPASKNFSVLLDPITLSVGIEKPTGLSVGVEAIKTGVKLELLEGKGTVTVLPLSAEVAAEIPKLGKRSFPVRWEGVTLTLGAEGLDVSLGKLALDAVSLAAVNVHGALEDGALKGAPAGEVVGLHLDAAKLNEFLGRELLKHDVDLGTRIREEGGEPRIDLAVNSGKAQVKLLGKLNASRSDSPVHDVSVTVTDVDTTELLVDPEGKVPPIKIASLSLQANGSGKSAEAIDTRAKLKLTDVSVRGVPIQSVDGDLQLKGNAVTIESLNVAALGQKLRASGTFDRASKEVDATVLLSGDVGQLLSELAAAGVPISTKLPLRTVELPEDDLHIKVKGAVGGNLRVTAGATALKALGGKVGLRADVSLRKGDPEKNEKSLVLEGGEADIDVTGLRLSSILALRGRYLPKALGLDAGINLHVKAKGTRAEPILDLRADVTTSRKDGGRRARAELVAHVDPRTARLTLDARDAATREAFLTIAGEVPIVLNETDRKLDDSRPFDVRLSLPNRALSELLTFVPPSALEGKKLPQADIEASVHAFGSFANPSGSVKLSAKGPLLAPDNPKLVSKLSLEGELTPGPKTSADFAGELAVFIDAASERTVSSKLALHLPYSVAQGGLNALTYDAKVDVGPLDLSKLPDVEKLARVRAIGGKVSAKAHVHGNRRDLLAELTLDAAGLLNKLNPARSGGEGPLALKLQADLGGEATTINLATTLEGEPLAAITGSLGVAGTGLLARIKQGLDPALNLELTIPERSLASFAALSGKAQSLPGRLSGTGKLHGSAKNVLANVDLQVNAVPMWSGTDGGARIKLDVGSEQLSAVVGWGSGKEPPLKLVANVPREALKGFSDSGAPLPIHAGLEGDQVDLRDLLPKLVSEKLPVEPSGKLNANLKAEVELEKLEGKTVVKQGGLDGLLKLSGNVPIPGTKRVVSDLLLELAAQGDVVTLQQLSAKESDQQEKNRTLKISGVINLTKLKPQTAKLRIEASKWLLFGTKNIGMADAPRGTLSADVRVEADLSKPIRAVQIDVDKLEALFPDRFEKAHQPEDVHAGDLIDVTGNESERGKLPVPASVTERLAKERAAKEAPTDAASAAEPTGTDISLRVHPGARVFQAPIDFTTSGQLNVAIRGSERTIRGKLTMSKGELSLGGGVHPLTAGSFVFDDAHPAGNVDLTFEKKLDPWALRGISEKSAGQSLKIHMTGPLSDRKTVISGAGSPGGLFDVLAMHNEGRERFVSGPDMPESVTVDFPQHQGLLVLSFIAVNLPHLLFLDRVSGWGDPYDQHRAYGRIENYDAERFFADGDARFKATMRPEGIGRSDAEVEVDYLFTNEPRLMFGVGVAAGSRGGGGPGLMLEWSSTD